MTDNERQAILKKVTKWKVFAAVGVIAFGFLAILMVDRLIYGSIKSDFTTGIQEQMFVDRVGMPSRTSLPGSPIDRPGRARGISCGRGLHGC